MEDKRYQLAEMTDSLKIIGRTEVLDGGIACDFTASGIEFNAYVQGAVRLTVQATAETYFTVCVDGVRSDVRYQAFKGTTVLEIASFGVGGMHTICVWKQNEPQLSLCVLTELAFCGYFVAPPTANAHYVEFIGDSITCGCGNLCPNGTDDPNSALHEDGTQAFAFLTAQGLAVDYSIVGCSGIGITNGYRPFPESGFYPKHSLYRSPDKPYVPARIPNLLVINLGTNDRTRGTDALRLAQDAGELIDLIREINGKEIPVIWIFNMMNDGYIEQVRDVISAKGGEAAGIYLCELNKNREGGNGHPTVAAHRMASERLTAFIREKQFLN